MDSREIEMIICSCRSLGCTTKEIQTLIKPLKSISIRKIQRVIAKVGYNERKERSSTEDIKAAICEELNGPGSLLGYRSMWRRLQTKYKLSVSRDTVMMLLAITDKAGTAQRKSRRLNRRIYLNKGPNYLWHLDGYDKIKPYGIAIHGCIDGYSRKILWLQAASSNNDPRIIAAYYMHFVRSVKGCPRMVRADMGTENSLLAIIQPILRHFHTDCLAGYQSFIYGRSICNQRIEALWCQLRKHHMDWWISFFKSLVVNRFLDIHLPYHLDIVRFCFGALIQTQLDEFLQEWNNHRIRPSKKADAPAGVPDVMYYCPSIYGTYNHLMNVDTSYLSIVESEMSCVSGSFVNLEFAIIANIIRVVHGLQPPNSFDSAVTLFCVLLKIFD